MPPLHPHHKARRHLSRRDAVMKKLIKLIGPCTLQCNSDGFRVLVSSIVSQQISTKAAKSIMARLLELQPLTPADVLKQKPETVRSAGLTANKLRAILDLAQKVQDGTVNFQELPDLDDEEVITRLLPVYGIGRWTAEMFLIFSLGRLDVLPLADLGLRVGMQRQYELEERPLPAKLTEMAEPWRPYRSIATWYLWRSFGAVPQS
jgi:DNA-3-methyladenine glycosylase II